MATWTFNSTFSDKLVDQEIDLTDILYEYDEPVIFRGKIGALDCIFNKISSRNDGSYYLANEVDDKTISALKSGKLSVRGAFTSKAYWIFYKKNNTKDFYYSKLYSEEVPDRFLPKSGVPMYYWQEEAPDSLAQANSLFSIKFKGEGLNDKSIPLGKLKHLVDKSFTTVRALLTPIDLLNTKSTTLDYECEIALSSFVVAVQNPIINLQAINRRPGQEDLTIKGIEKGIIHRGNVLSSKLLELHEFIEGGKDISAYASENLILTMALSYLLPDDESFFESVEFSASYGESIKRVVFDKNDSHIIHKALEDIEGKVVQDKGKISGGTEKARTVRIMSLRGRQVTCKFSADDFSLVAPEGKLDLSRYISVWGVLEKRDRVDFMKVEKFSFFDPSEVSKSK